jgi:hypothetical protein
VLLPRKRRVSKKTELENKQSSLETRFDDKFNKLSDLFQDMSSALGTNDTVISQPGGLVVMRFPTLCQHLYFLKFLDYPTPHLDLGPKKVLVYALL